MQDFFDARLLSMDTDFRMFSARHLGSLPGLDLAHVLDGSAYHTDRDTPARIRAGTLQVSNMILQLPLSLSCSVCSMVDFHIHLRPPVKT